MYNFDQALARLAELTKNGPTTRDALLELASQVSAETEGVSAATAQTLAYSGDLPNGEKAGPTIDALRASGKQVRVIDGSPAAKLFLSEAFKDAVAKTFNPAWTAAVFDKDAPDPTAKNWMFHATQGPWAKASANFARGAVGDVKVLGALASADRTFALVELPELLKNLKVTSIDGIPIEVLRDIHARFSIDEVFKLVKVNALWQWHTGGLAEGDIVRYLTQKGDDITAALAQGSEGKLKSFLAGIDELNGKGLLLKVEVLKTVQRAQIYSVAKNAALDSVKLTKFGVVFGMISLALTSGTAMAEPDPEKRGDIMKEWAAGMLGSTVGQALGVAAGTVAVGLIGGAAVVGSPLAALVVVGAGLLGGIFGGNAAEELYRLTKDSDNNTKIDLEDKLNNLVFGALTTTGLTLPADLDGNRLTLNASLNREDVVNNAKSSIAWRYALRGLNPFVVTDISYDKYNTDGSLDLYNSATGEGAMTDRYLRDRAAMLTWKLLYESGARDADDLVRSGSKPYNEDWDSNTIEGNWDFVDLTQRIPGGAPLTLAIDGVGLSAADHQIVFGSVAGETISGGSDSDWLYGMAGTDSVLGMAGNDYLEGGLGDDTLRGGDGLDILLGGSGTDMIDGGKGLDSLSGGMGDDIFNVDAGDGWDTIVDAEAGDRLFFGGSLIKGDGTKKVGDNLWKSADGQFTFALFDTTENGFASKTLTIGTATGGEGVWVKNFSDGKLGITLGVAAPPPAPDWTGDAGNDYHASSAGPGRYSGGDGFDYIKGSSGADLIEGGNGKDWLISGGGNDTIDGGDGNDYMMGGNGASVFLGGAGNDVMYASGNEREMRPTSLPSLPGFSMSIFWSDFATYEFFPQSSIGTNGDKLEGGFCYTASGPTYASGPSAMAGWTVSFSLDATSTLWTETYSHPVIAPQGYRTQGGGFWADPGATPNERPVVMDGGIGDDFLAGALGADVLSGGAGNDQIFGGGNNDNILGGSGGDILSGYDGDDLLDGGADGDWVIGDMGDDTLFGGAGDDTLWGDSSTSEPTPVAGNDWLDGGDGSDVLVGGAGDDALSGGADADQLLGQDGDDSLDGGTGKDTLVGGAGADYLEGGDGSDALSGDDGNDTLVGGGGADVLNGGAGKDTYLIGADEIPIVGGAAESIIDSAGEGNVVVFGPGITVDALELSTSGDGQLYIGYGDAGLVVQGGLSGSILDYAFNSGGKSLRWYELIGQRYAWTRDITSNKVGDDVVGGNKADTLRSTGGHANVSGGMGNDTITIEGGDNTVLYNLGDGTDRIGGTGGIITTMLARAAAPDIDSELSPFAVSATPSGATLHTNTLRFGEGITADSVRLLVDYGSLSLVRDGDEAPLVVLSNFSNYNALGTRTFDRFEFADGVSLSYEELIARGLEAQGTEAANTLFGSNLSDKGYGWGGNDLINLLAGDDQLSGGAGNDTLFGGDGNDTLDGGAGDDSLSGDAGDDVILFGWGDGQDTLSGKAWAVAGNDIVSIREGILPADVTVSAIASTDDLLLEIGGHGAVDSLRVEGYFAGTDGAKGVLEGVRFADGTTWSKAELLARARRATEGADAMSGDVGDDLLAGGAGDDLIMGRAGADTLDGGAGNDWLYGQDGANVYLFGRGSGSDWIVADSANPGVDPGDTLRLVGLRSDEAIVSRLGYDLTVTIKDTGERIRGFGAIGDTPSSLLITKIEFDDVTLDADGIRAKTLVGTAASDKLFGYTSDDRMFGAGDGDELHGRAGADTLDGGAGGDWLYGDDGADTYLFGRGSESDVIFNDDADAPNTNPDTILIQGGVRPEDVAVSHIGDDLKIAINNSPDAVVVKNYFKADATTSAVVELIKFEAGGSWDVAEVMRRVVGATQGNDSVTGFSGADLISGGDGADTLSGMAGNDTLNGDGGRDSLTGGAGNDVLEGGAGADELWGGEGDDLYQFGVGDGSDTIVDNAGEFDTIAFKAGVSPSDVALYRVSTAADNSGGDLYVSVKGSTQQIKVIGQFNAGGGSQIDAIRFADSAVWDATKINTLATPLTRAAITINGTAGSDVFRVGNPRDVISDLGGNDWVESDFGFDARSNSAIENIRLTGVLNTAAFDNDLDNRLVGNSGDNILYSGRGADTLSGGAGDDLYIEDGNRYGYGGDEIVEIAGEGFDTLESHSMSFELPDNVEAGISKFALSEMYYTTSVDFQLSGNSLDNVLDASALKSDQYLTDWTGQQRFIHVMVNGGVGRDTMIGGSGTSVFNTYTVDDPGDVIIHTETGSALRDGVRSSIDYVMPEWCEDLWLTGENAVRGVGNYKANRISGAANAASNVLIGGAGDDVYEIDLSDSVVELANEGNDQVVVTIQDGQTVMVSGYTNIERLKLGGGFGTVVGDERNNEIVGSSGGDLLLGAVGNDSLTDDATFSFGNDTLDGGAGDDVLTSNGGNDEFDGGAGNDLMVARLGNGGASYASYTADTYHFGIGYGHDTIDDQRGSDSVVFGAAVGRSDVTWLREEDDLIATLTSGDSLRIRAHFASGGINAVERFRFSDGSEVSSAQIEARMTPLKGTEGDDSMLGGANGEMLLALGGNDTLDGGVGEDVLDGGAGNDRYLVDVSTEVVIERLNDGYDTVVASCDFSLPEFVEELQLVGAGGAATGNDGNNRIVGNSSVFSVLDGRGGADTLVGGSAGNKYVVDNVGDVVLGPLTGYDWVASSISYALSDGLEDLQLTGSDDISATGNAQDNYLVGNAGNNVFDGLGGADRMAGEGGNDTYVVDSDTDQVEELSGQGTDTVLASVTYVLSTDPDNGNVENLTLTGSLAINATGNALDNVLRGNSAANTLKGGAGNDTYYVSAGDIVTESSNQGTDSVFSDVTWTLSTNVEHLTLTGTANIDGTGNTSANRIVGNSGGNVLSGGSGIDTMVGGAGNDTYVVDNVGDVVTELAAEGVDLVQSSVTYTLGANVENLTLTGSSAISGTGNLLNNVLTGNSGANKLTGGGGNDRLSGLAGADTMLGGAGDDTYVVDATTDVITENTNEGIDTVESSVSLTLSSNVENLMLTGTSALTATGNALDNILTGNSGANKLTGAAGNDRLIGLAGNDTMLGGAGNDVYVVDVATDVVTENANEGTDTVESSVTLTLAANVENLTLTGSATINGTGNTLANVLIGNAAANTLSGGAGLDTIQGGLGNDSVDGGVGNDTYLFGRGDQSDTLTDADSAAGNQDTLLFGTGVTAEQLWFRKVGTADLEVSIIGTADKITIKNWSASGAGTNNQIEVFKTADGRTLSNAKVANLVTAMASLTPPAIGQTTLPASYQTALLSTINANWTAATVAKAAITTLQPVMADAPVIVACDRWPAATPLIAQCSRDQRLASLVEAMASFGTDVGAFVRHDTDYRQGLPYGVNRVFAVQR